MTGKQIQVGSVGGKALAVVIECVDSSIRLRDASYAVTPATKVKRSLADVVHILELKLLTSHRSCIRRCNHCMYTISLSSHVNIKRRLPEMDDIVHGILAHRVSVGIEETKCCIFCQLTHTPTQVDTGRHGGDIR